MYLKGASWIFQSTLPTRGSDAGAPSGPVPQMHFNPRSPRGGATRPCAVRCEADQNFNPRSPRGGATCRRAGAGAGRTDDFNPRSPRGGATCEGTEARARLMISIHAPHEGERPASRRAKAPPSWYFNPRSPRGGATCRFPAPSGPSGHFNPRSPRGGATHRFVPHAGGCAISIHAPHEGERPK